MSDLLQDKILNPTPLRRQRARQEGQVACSRDVVAGVVSGAAFAWLGWGGGETFWQQLQMQLGDALGTAPQVSLHAEGASQIGRMAILQLARIGLPVLLFFSVVAVVAHVVQIGFLWRPQAVLPDWDRVNPISGARRMVAWNRALEFVMSLGKTIVLLTLGGMLLWKSRLLWGADKGHESPLAVVMRVFESVIGPLILAIAAMAALDYAMRRWQFERNLRMTPAEMRQEQEAREGDPQLRSKRLAIRARSRQNAR